MHEQLKVYEDTDSDSAGGECIRTGGADDSDSAVGEEYVKGDYQSDPDVGYRNQSDQ